jgi:phosphopantothenoylcysteine decarboxylase/phosphopantothenate--cysteine ligase
MTSLPLKVLITAGPTVEPIDPVRYISNHSTGKMGIALAEEFAARNCTVTLIKGPTTLKSNSPAITEVPVQTAAEMYDACTQYFAGQDVIVFAAAVADYTPKNPATTKIKKRESEFSIELVRTKDIARELGKQKRENQVLVGFALETDNEIDNASEKLQKKNLDLIVLNSTRDKGAGFGFDTNKISTIDKQGNVTTFDMKLKTEVAKDIVNEVFELLKRKRDKKA